MLVKQLGEQYAKTDKNSNIYEHPIKHKHDVTLGIFKILSVG